MNRLEKLLFQLTIFLIPSNLFLKWILPESYVHGILVDYLLPKLYLSDLSILGLLFLWFWQSLPMLNKPMPIIKKTIKKNLPAIIASLLFFILFLKAVLSTHPAAALWFWLKLIQMTAFFLWIKAHPESLKHLTSPLISALLFQSFLGLYQFFAQNSLAGFWFLGEPTLTQSPNIAKTSLTNFTFPQASSLAITPYGTTPHSNVLAGFLVIAIIILFLQSRLQVQHPIYQKGLITLTYIVSTITIFLTFSASAWIALFAALIVIGLRLPSSKSAAKLLIFAAITLVSALLSIKFNLTALLIDEYSSLRRTQLIRSSLVMLRDNPTLGVGLNQFTVVLPSIRVISSYTSFLQPVHQIFLLWLSETGLVGLILLSMVICWFTLNSLHHLHQSHQSIIYLLPIGLIIIIGLFDHYPLSLQTGQLLTVLALGIASKKIEDRFITL